MFDLIFKGAPVDQEPNFVTGQYVRSENGLPLFSQITINHFYKRLLELKNNTLAKVADKVRMTNLDLYQGLEDWQIIEDYFKCDIVKEFRNGPDKIIKIHKAHPYADYINQFIVDKKDHYYNGFYEILECFHSDYRATDSEDQTPGEVLIKLQKEGFINAYSNGSRMIDVDINFRRKGVNKYNYDPDCGENNIIIIFNINTGKRKSNYFNSDSLSLIEGKRKRVLKRTVDTKFKVVNLKQFLSGEETEIKGYIDNPGINPFVFDWNLHKLQVQQCEDLSLSSNFIYIMDTVQVLAKSIFDRLKAMSKYKVSDLEPLRMKETIEAVLRQHNSIDTKYNRASRVLMRLKVIDEAPEYEDSLTGTIKRQNNGQHRFNLLDKIYKDKSYSDCITIEKTNIDKIREIKQKLALNWKMTSEKQMEKDAFSLESLQFEKFLRLYLKYNKSIGFKFMLNENEELQCDHILGSDNQLAIPFDYSLAEKLRNHGPMLDHLGISSYDLNKLDKLHNKKYEINLLNNYNYLNEENIKSSFGKGKANAKKINVRTLLGSCDAFKVDIANPKVNKNGLKFDRRAMYLTTETNKFGSLNDYDINLLTGVLELDLPKFIMAGGEEIDTSNCQTFDDFREVITSEVYARMSNFESEAYNRLFEGNDGSSKINANLASDDIYIIAKRSEKIVCHPSQFSEELIEILRAFDVAKENDDKVEFKYDSNNKVLTHYTCLCPSKTEGGCGEGQMISSEFNRTSEVIDIDLNSIENLTRLTPDTERFKCVICNHEIDNYCQGYVSNTSNPDYDPDARVKKNYLGSKKQGYDRFVITGYTWKEGILNLKVNYYFPLKGTRAAGDSYLKTILVGCNQDLIGVVPEFEVYDPDKKEYVKFNNVELDMLTTLNAYKGGLPSLVCDQLRLTNALFNKKYNIRDFANGKVFDPTLVKLNTEVLQHAKKSLVEVNLYDYEESVTRGTFLYKNKTVSMYVVLSCINATEVSQENNKVFTWDHPRRIAKQDGDLLNMLGMENFVNALYEEVSTKNFSDLNTKKIVKELIAIRECLCNPIVANQNNEYHDEARQHIWDKFTSDIPKERSINSIVEKLRKKHMTSTQIKNRIFYEEKNKRVDYSSYMPFSDYYKLLEFHPLLKKDPNPLKNIDECTDLIPKIFNDGTYFDVVMSKYANGQSRNYKYRLRFPSRNLMLWLVDKTSNGQRVKLHSAFIKFLGMYNAFSTSEFNEAFTIAMYNKDFIRRDNFSYDLKDNILKLLAGKKGIFNQTLSINMVAVQGKQCSGRIPYGYSVVGNHKMWKKLLREYINIQYPDGYPGYKNEDIEQLFNQKRLPAEFYHITIPGFIHRDPAAFCKQMATPCRIVYKEYMGKEFLRMYPYFDGIMINSIYLVRDQESDSDGDIVSVCAVIAPYLNSNVEKIMNNWLEERTSDINGYYRIYKEPENNDKDYINMNGKDILISEVPNVGKAHFEAKVRLAQFGRNSTYKYYMNEAEKLFTKMSDSLVFTLYNSIFPRTYKDIAIEEARESKGDVAFLTLSFWKTLYVTDYLLYLKKNGIIDQERRVDITPKSRLALLDTLSYGILQLQGTRGIKSEGAFSGCTDSAYYEDKKVEIRDSWDKLSNLDRKDEDKKYTSIRDLFYELVKSYDDEFKTDLLSTVIPLMDSITNNFMLAPENGGEYYYDNSTATEKIRSLLSYDSSYNRIKKNKERIKDEISKMDHNYVHLLGLYMLINARSLSSYISTFGEEALLQGLIGDLHLTLDGKRKEVSNILEGLNNFKHLCKALKEIYR